MAFLKIKNKVFLLILIIMKIFQEDLLCSIYKYRKQSKD